MSDIMSMEQLIGSAQGLKNAIEANTKMHITPSAKSSNKSSSKHDLEYAQLKAKYFTFAQTFGVELDMFLNSVSQSIKQEQLRQEQERHRMQEAEQERKMLQQKKEKERLMENSEEIRSNSHPTIVEVEDHISLDYSPASSVTYNDPEPEQSRLSAPASPIITKKVVKKEVVKAAKQTKKTKTKTKKKVIRKKAVKGKPKSQPKAPKPKPQKAVNEVQHVEQKEEPQPQIVYEPYKYNAQTVNWAFDEFGVCRSTTIVFVGNLPPRIQNMAVKFFVMKKANVKPRQIENITLRNGTRGKYALVRFRRDVLISKINAFINNVNTENAELSEKQKKNDNGMSSGNKNQGRVSWQKRVFLKHNETFRYFKNEAAMWNDPTARHGLHVRNFDILNSKCHKELTEAFLQCGDLYKDIQIRLDGYGEPFCLVVFRRLEDAIWCCNSEIIFGGRVLEMKYDRWS